MSFTAYMLDVISDTIYPARITIENGIFIPISILKAVWYHLHNLLELQCVMVPPL